MNRAGERLDNGILELHSLDVGQADAAIIITEEGQIILNDADKKKVIEGIESVLADRIVDQTENGNIPLTFTTTHFHQDHIKGLANLGYNNYEVSHAFNPDIRRIEVLEGDTSGTRINEKTIKDYKNDLNRLNTSKFTQVSCSDEIPIDSDANLHVLAPPDTDESVEVTRASTGADVNLPPERPNENSAVYKLDGEQSALFMGDVQDETDHYGESWLIQEHDDPESEVDLDADVLFVAHHGSNNATSEEFLERVDPKRAVISSDLGKQYDHPTETVLENLHDREIDVHWTAGHGTTRLDLDSNGAHPEPTTDLETTDAADLAALKHYCREHEIDPETVGVLPPDLPEETPAWAIDAAPMIADTQEQFIDEAVANAETVEDLRQTLDPTPDAHDQLREAVQADREAHVTTKADVTRNKEAYFEAVERERDYKRLPLHTRLRTNLPTRFGGIEHPLTDGPSSDEMDALPRNIENVPKAVRNDPAAKLRAEGDFVNNWSRSLLRAETAADTAVDDAHTPHELCRHLRDTPGAHQDFLYAIDTPDAHEQNTPEKDIDDLLERTNQRERTEEQTHTHDQDASLGL